MHRKFQACLALLFCVGCSSELLFEECNIDKDCQRYATSGMSLFCTDDHLCVRGTPAQRLCSEVYPPGSPDNAVVIGALVEIPGANSTLLIKAYKLAIEQINAKRAAAPPLALHVCVLNVTQDDPAKAMKILVEQRHAVAVVGPDFSREVIAIKDEVIASGVPIMSAGATSPEISSLGTLAGPVDRLFYRVVPTDTLQGAVLAGLLPAPLPIEKSLALLYVNETYGIGLKDAFVKAAARQPAPIVPYEEPLEGPDPEGTFMAVARVLETSPNYLVAVPNRYAHVLVKEMVFQPAWSQLTQIIMGEACKTQDVLDLLDDPKLQAQGIDKLLERIIGTAPTIDAETTLYREFARAFAKLWPQDSDPSATVFTGYAYDALYALGIAIGAAGEHVTPVLVSELLSRINSHDGTACVTDSSRKNLLVVGPSGYVEATNKLRTANQGGLVLDGISGKICFNPHGDRIGGAYEKWSVDTKSKAFHKEVIP